MATETKEYKKVVEFMEKAKIEECLIESPELPELLRRFHAIHWLCMGLGGEYEHYKETGKWRKSFKVYTSGWTDMEGVMIITPEEQYDADVKIGIAADNERALRELLLSCPRAKMCFFYCTSEWMLNTISEFFEGDVMPSLVGYFAKDKTFTPLQSYPVKKLEQDDYELVSAQWSRDVWNLVVEEYGYTVFAINIDRELKSLCFNWSINDWRSEVNGLAVFVDNWRKMPKWESEVKRYAESVFSSATQDVIEKGEVATCTATFSSNHEFIKMLNRLGYIRHYQIPLYRGIKRGSGKYIDIPHDEFLRGRTKKENKCKKITKFENNNLIIKTSRNKISISGKKISDSVISEFRELSSLRNRLKLSKFVVEGDTLVKRALYDGLPVDKIIYTSELLENISNIEILSIAFQQNVIHRVVSKGLMGAVTTTRPVPTIIASVYTEFRNADYFHLSSKSSLLICDSVANPGNLGMILRTADASGIEGVVLIGEGAALFHKNCVRAARGAVGRIPVMKGESDEDYLKELIENGFNIIGTSAKAERDLYSLSVEKPLAFIVGNESYGMRENLLNYCNDIVRIPMAPGQSSLNVGVATGIILYVSLVNSVKPQTYDFFH